MKKPRQSDGVKSTAGYAIVTLSYKSSKDQRVLTTPAAIAAGFRSRPLSRGRPAAQRQYG